MSEWHPLSDGYPPWVPLPDSARPDHGVRHYRCRLHGVMCSAIDLCMSCVRMQNGLPMPTDVVRPDYWQQVTTWEGSRWRCEHHDTTFLDDEGCVHCLEEDGLASKPTDPLPEYRMQLGESK